MSVPCSPSHTWTVPQGLTFSEQESYAFSHPGEATVTPCVQPTQLEMGVQALVDANGKVIGQAISGQSRESRYRAAQKAYEAAISTGATESAAIAAAVSAYNAAASNPQAPAAHLRSIRPRIAMACPSGNVNKFTSNNDTVLDANNNFWSHIQWEQWYLEGSACVLTFQQTQYQPIDGRTDSTWVQGSQIDGGYNGLTVGSPNCGQTCHTNIPARWDYGSRTVLTGYNYDNTWYCTNVSPTGQCVFWVQHPDDYIPTDA